MTITLPLAPQEEAKLIAIERSEGLPAAALIGEVMAKVIADSSAANFAKDRPALRSEFSPTTGRLFQPKKSIKIAR